MRDEASCGLACHELSGAMSTTQRLNPRLLNSYLCKTTCHKSHWKLIRTHTQKERGEEKRILHSEQGPRHTIADLSWTRLLFMIVIFQVIVKNGC